MGFFWIELTAFNLLLVYLLFRQENMSRSLLTMTTQQPGML
jgi:hypothetical protein